MLDIKSNKDPFKELAGNTNEEPFVMLNAQYS